MIALSAACLAIALADERGDLSLVERNGRFGSFIAISDATGIIEVADDMAEANRRIEALRIRRAA